VSLATDFSEALAELEDVTTGDPQTITWNSQILPCIATGRTKTGTLGDGGWAPETDLVVIVRGELFDADSPPVSGQTLTHAGGTYRIDRVMTAPGSAFFRLGCISAAKGV
jgi:hypothetical protein